MLSFSLNKGDSANWGVVCDDAIVVTTVLSNAQLEWYSSTDESIHQSEVFHDVACMDNAGEQYSTVIPIALGHTTIFVNLVVDGKVIGSAEVINGKYLSSFAFDNIFPDFDRGTLSIRKLAPCGKGMVSYLARHHVGAHSRQVSSLGIPLLSKNWVAITRRSAFWLQPATGTEYNLDKDCFGFFVRRSDNLHVAIIGLSGNSEDSSTTLIKPNDDTVHLETQNDSDAEQSSGVVIGIGLNLIEVISMLFCQVKRLSHLLSDPSENVAFDDPLKEALESKKSETSWIDSLMYCTWNSLGTGPPISHEKIINALQDLHDTDLRIGGIIIDDGWQDTTNDRTLVSFHPNNNFPAGLEGLVADIKKKFPYISQIGVWSTIAGYWNGFTLELAKKYSYVEATLNGRTIYLPDEKGVFDFYKDYYSYLSKSGVTCVKTDYQAIISEIQESDIRGRLWKPYQDAFYKYSMEYFDRRVIYCMEMVPDIMSYALLPRVGPRPVARNSEDFFPLVVDSHLWHIYSNFTNGLITGHFHSVPDFDMFQTRMPGVDDKLPSLHSAARALSGGPIYITDIPKEHNLELIKSFSAVGPDGTLMAPRVNFQAQNIDPYHAFYEDKLYCVLTTAGGDNTAVLGLFNLRPRELTEVLSCEARRVMYSYRSGLLWTAGESQEVTVGELEWDVVSEPALTTIGKHNFAVVGLTDLIVGASAVESITLSTDSEFDLVLKAFGDLLIYSNTASSMNFTFEGKKYSFTKHGTKFTCKLPVQKCKEIRLTISIK